MKKRIAIIGAGPTGIFTTLFLEKFDGEIILFEQNKDIGEKLKITGGGRMNVTNKKFSAEDFFSSTLRLKDNFFKTSYTENREQLFDTLGVEYVWEKNRAILKSQDAKKEVLRLREKIAEQKNCSIKFSTKINDIKPTQDGKFEINGEIFDICILTIGGMFRMKDSQTSKEYIYSLPSFFGHSVTSTSPSLSPLRENHHLLKDCSGISLVAKIFSGKQEITDSMIITHFGYSGPALLDFTAIWKRKEKIFINFCPDESQEKFSTGLRDTIQRKISIKKYLKNFLPAKLGEKIIEICEIDPQKNCSEISKKEEKNLCSHIFSFPVTEPQTMPYQGTWTTKGGISLKEVNMHTLESKLQKNLFFGGEVLDIDGLCGGYHITLAAICGKKLSDAVLG